MLLSVRGRREALTARLNTALDDSVQTAGQVEAWRATAAARDSLAVVIAAVEDLDARRYPWPRLLDEVAAALPAGVWLTRLGAAPSEPERLRFRIEGHAPDSFTLTRFWNAMEASPFVRDVQLLHAAQVSLDREPPSGRAAVAHNFVLEAELETPPAEVIGTERAASLALPAGSAAGNEVTP